MWIFLLSLVAPDLGWLAGTWRGSQPDGTVVEERWSAPAAGALIGTNRTLRAGAPVAFEFLRIEPVAGQLTYLAQPGGRSPATAFALAEHGPLRAVFTNPTHDFPQKIEYLREGATLTATVSGAGGPTLVFRLARVAEP